MTYIIDNTKNHYNMTTRMIETMRPELASCYLHDSFSNTDKSAPLL